MRIGNVQRQAAVGVALIGIVHPLALYGCWPNAQFMSVDDVGGKLAHAMESIVLRFGIVDAELVFVLLQPDERLISCRAAAASPSGRIDDAASAAAAAAFYHLSLTPIWPPKAL
ncbi:hypothetical protein MesoLjLc_23730 [Mesorhizobium sp. L-8-10]|nr:hypothetical protein MesoLjLc_23730 [Mesorhizobium sp. L-8-10]